jgi:hypothetical protein
MKKRILIVLMAALPIIMLANAVFADDHEWKGFHGEYAMTLAGFCLFSTSTFSPGYPACDGSAEGNALTCWNAQIVAEGIWSFNRGGKGSFAGSQFGMAPPPFANPNVLPVDLAFDFTYQVTKDGEITAAIVPGTFVGTWLAGPMKGLTYTVDIFNFFGMVSKDRKTITLNSNANDLQNFTSAATGMNIYGRCNLSRTLIQIGN